MENKTKGRPPKPAQKRKRLQYSVWVSAEEKKQIDALVESSNISASQYFLTLAINKPFEKPKKKNLPKTVAEQIVNLEKLSGLLALSVLKTKDKMMLAAEWQESSLNVKWITRMISLWIFAEFDLHNFSQKLRLVEEKSKLLYWHIDAQNNNQDKLEILKTIVQINKLNNELIDSFGKQFETNELPFLHHIWSQDLDIHHEIKKLKETILKR